EYMRRGKELQQEFSDREGRRVTLGGLKRLKVNERIFNVRLSSLKLCVQGVADLVVRTGDEWAAVELKGGRKPHYPSLGHRVQVAAYGMLLEESMRKLVRRAFIVYDNGYHEVRLDEGARRHVIWTIGKVREIYEGKIPRLDERGRCEACGYFIYCFK
ncbi:MAG: CRISPR-associated protein Cas4, partial [Candidatus Korarchaeum sp.]|nr:CRISPR-associated protein Cas4 [Candidatus Korarchaeum sp.]